MIEISLFYPVRQREGLSPLLFLFLHLVAVGRDSVLSTFECLLGCRFAQLCSRLHLDGGSVGLGVKGDRLNVLSIFEGRTDLLGTVNFSCHTGYSDDTRLAGLLLRLLICRGGEPHREDERQHNHD